MANEASRVVLRNGTCDCWSNTVTPLPFQRNCDQCCTQCLSIHTLHVHQGEPFRMHLTLAVSRADSRSEARAEAVGVGSSAWLGPARTISLPAPCPPHGCPQRLVHCLDVGQATWMACSAWRRQIER